MSGADDAREQLLTAFSRYGSSGARINVILMISDGMGASCSPPPRFEPRAERANPPPAATGPASETMSREFLQYMHDTQGEGTHGSLLNGSVWRTLAGGFERGPGGFGLTPLDEMLVGASRVRREDHTLTE